ncbi:hypothetical protein [Massilia putida]|uniref:hypothetical protein n=1 Tax=Massilia putida TaxID=1141883 RepID=UPI00095324B5|nr:hypothetical protein [Massilia putida]
MARNVVHDRPAPGSPQALAPAHVAGASAAHAAGIDPQDLKQVWRRLARHGGPARPSAAPEPG